MANSYAKATGGSEGRKARQAVTNVRESRTNSKRRDDHNGQIPQCPCRDFLFAFSGTRGDSSGFSPLEEEKRTKRVKLDAWKRNSERTRARTSVIMGSLFCSVARIRDPYLFCKVRLGKEDKVMS